ncbi:1,4-dihydroxy-2-naphthoate phytyltransferase [Gracilaria domingensis]|nr:1,4-dihydroxy-2-naphthoate phytyltransferase [Gracilaria domingensis]
MRQIVRNRQEASKSVARVGPPPSSLAAPLTKKHLWLAAIKPPMYTVAVTPMAVGSLASFYHTDQFQAQKAVLLVSAAILTIAWLNLSNDAFDFDTGVDRNKKESIVNLLGGTRKMRHVVLVVANLFLVVAFLMFYVLFRNDMAPFYAIAIAVFEGYIYQSPPFRLSYKGLGELLCFTAFFIATTAAYYSQANPFSYESLSLSKRLLLLFSLPFQDQSVLCASVLVAFPTSLILFCSHFHQVHDDAAVGKLSPIVRLGTFIASRVLCVLIGLFFVMQTYFFYTESLPVIPFFLSFFAFPLLFSLALFVYMYHDQPTIVRVAKYKAVVFHFVHERHVISCLKIFHWFSHEIASRCVAGYKDDSS